MVKMSGRVRRDSIRFIPRGGIAVLDTKITKELREIVGEKNYLDSPEDLMNYSYDGFIPEAMPEVVLLPLTTQEVSDIMKVAYREEIPVTPRGAGTNICGGSVPMKGGIVLGFTRMNRILEINKEDRLAAVQPGVINAELQAEVEKRGLFYPPDPASMSVCTMAGNVALNAGGPRGVKYGVTRDYILGLTVVLPDGRIIRVGGRTAKNVTGIDLVGFFTGSKGTLGVITEIVCKLLPKPEANQTMQAIFNDLDLAGKAVAKIMEEGMLPVALELMDSVVINLVEDSAHVGLPREAEGILLIMMDGPQESVKRQVEDIAQLCRDQGATEVRVAKNQEEENALWFARRSAFGVMARSRPNCIVEDVTVPVSKVPVMIREIVGIARKYDLVIGVLAHAGDGNMHPLLLTDQREKDEWERAHHAIRDIVLKAAELGGTLSGEHGIGMAKAEFLDLVMDKETRRFMEEIKKAVDPKGILNPGKFV